MTRLSRFTFIVLLIITVSFIWTVFHVSKWRNNLVIHHDVVSYYAYLPATFIYQDLTFRFIDDLPEDFTGRIWYQTAANGTRVQKMTMGLSVFYSPFFFTAHAITKFTGKNANGYSPYYSLFISLAGLFYGLLGLVILSKILLRYFTDQITALCVLIIAFGTNFFYYTTHEGEMAHSVNFFLFSVFLYFILQWRQRQSLFSAVAIGLATGFIILIRPSNIVVCVIPILYGVYSKQTLLQQWDIIKRHPGKILLMVLPAALIFAPQLFYWKTMTGQWFYYSYGNQGFFFARPHILDGLFSYRKGWLIYTPVMILSLAGLPLLFKHDRPFSYAITVFLLLNIYIIFSWCIWWYGGGFGARPLVESYAFLSVPLAAFLRYTFKQAKVINGTVMIAVIFLIGLNLFQTNQYRHNVIHWDSMTKEAYWAVFGKMQAPDRFNDLINAPDYEAVILGMPEQLSHKSTGRLPGQGK